MNRQPRWRRLFRTALASSALILACATVKGQEGPKISPIEAPPKSSTEAAPAPVAEPILTDGPVLSAPCGGCSDGHCPIAAGHPTAGGLDYPRGNIQSVPSRYGYPQFHYDRYRWNNYERFHKDRVTYHTQPPPQMGYTRYWHDYGYGANYSGHPQAVKRVGGACW